MKKAIERATGKEYMVKEIEGGFEIYEGDTLYKKVRESTFKKYFKLNKENKEETESEAQPKEVTAEKRQKMLDKIKKLMQLSKNNPSKEEALSAALMAQKLMAEYKISEEETTLEEIQEEDVIESISSNQKKNSHLLSWRKQLAVIVAKNFCCKTYMSGDDVVFRGYKQDAEVALDVYLYLYAVGNKLAGEAYGEQLRLMGTGKGAYNSFTAGFLQGIEDGLSVQCTALMLIVPKAVEEEYKTFSANFKKTTTRLSVTDAYLYKKGREEGKAAVKSRQLQATDGKKVK